MADQVFIIISTMLVSLFVGAIIISMFNLPEVAIAVFVLLGAAAAYFMTKKKNSGNIAL
jgi:positive regulator of sigma E activity